MRETGEIPGKVREAVYARDAGYCRVCGEYLKVPGIHHIVYGGDARGMGGRRVHEMDELITVGWRFPDADCHSRVHADKLTWQPLLLAVVHEPGVTAWQLRRWRAKGAST